jgi:hypothetical protein
MNFRLEVCRFKIQERLGSLHPVSTFGKEREVGGKKAAASKHQIGQITNHNGKLQSQVSLKIKTGL